MDGVQLVGVRPVLLDLVDDVVAVLVRLGEAGGKPFGYRRQFVPEHVAQALLGLGEGGGADPLLRRAVPGGLLEDLGPVDGLPRQGLEEDEAAEGRHKLFPNVRVQRFEVRPLPILGGNSRLGRLR